MEIFRVMTGIFIVYIFEKRNYLPMFLLTKILHSILINKTFINIFKTLILLIFQKNQLSLHNSIFNS